MTDKLIIPPLTFEASPRNPRIPLVVVQVGAGGTGARVLPAILKLLNPGDSVHVFDPDTVEERNLLRQHFGPRDVGQFKATVMAARYDTPDVRVWPHERAFVEAGMREAIQVSSEDREVPIEAQRVLLLGCVDTVSARKQMYSASHNVAPLPIAYIDAGNEHRSGQVLVSFRYWPGIVTRNGKAMGNYSLHLNGCRAMPQIWNREDEGPNCVQMIDTQTMAVNNTAACVMVNAAAMLLHGLPMTACGWIFTTFNAITAIPLTKFSSGYRQLYPDCRYAEKARRGAFLSAYQDAEIPNDV